MLSFSVICARQTLGVLKSILLVPEQSFFHCAICKTAFTLLTLAWIPPSCTVTRRPVRELGLWMPILQRGKPVGIPRSLHLWVVCSPSTIPCFSVIAHSVWCKEAFQKPGEMGLVHLACSFQAFWVPSLLVELARGAQLLWGPCCFQTSWKEGLPRFPGVSCRAIHKDSNKPSVDNCMKGNYPILPRGPFVHAHIPPVLCFCATCEDVFKERWCAAYPSSGACTSKCDIWLFAAQSQVTLLSFWEQTSPCVYFCFQSYCGTTTNSKNQSVWDGLPGGEAL